MRLESSLLISVVAPTFNRRRIFEHTLPTLFHQDIAATRFKVVVVKDGASDGTADFLHTLDPRFHLPIVKQPNHATAAARNAGLKRTSGELVLFLDDDILCPPNLLSLHASAHNDQSRRAVFGIIHTSTASAATLATDWARIGSLANTKMLNRGLTPSIIQRESI